MSSHPASEGLQYDYHSTLEVAPPTGKDGAHLVSLLPKGSEGLEAVDHEEVGQDSHAESTSRSQTVCGVRKRTFWILVLILLIAIVIAAAVGGAVGSRKPHQAAKHASAPSPTSTPTPSAPSAPILLSSSNLAAASWNETTNEKVVMQSRLYYQDTDGNIRESGWNSSSGKWYASNVLGVARNGTPIAVAITAPPDSNNFVGQTQEGNYKLANILVGDERILPQLHEQSPRMEYKRWREVDRWAG